MFENCAGVSVTSNFFSMFSISSMTISELIPKLSIFASRSTWSVGIFNVDSTSASTPPNTSISVVLDMSVTSVEVVQIRQQQFFQPVERGLSARNRGRRRDPGFRGLQRRGRRRRRFGLRLALEIKPMLQQRVDALLESVDDPANVGIVV